MSACIYSAEWHVFVHRFVCLGTQTKHIFNNDLPPNPRSFNCVMNTLFINSGYACPEGPQDVCIDLVEEIYDEFEKEQVWPTWSDAIADLAPASSNTDFSGGICYGIGDKKRRETCYLFYLSGCAVDQLNPSCADLVEDVIKIRQKKELFESGGFPSVISDHPCYALVESNKQEDMCLEYQEEDCASDDTTKDCQDVLKDVEKEYGRGVVPEWMEAFRPKLPVTDDNFFDLIKKYKNWDQTDYNNDVVPVYGKIEDWDVSRVTNMRRAFSSIGTLSCYRIVIPDVSSWDVSSVKTMEFMFGGKDHNHDLSGWNVSSVTNFGYLFQFNKEFNRDISSWDVSSGTFFEEMFDEAKSFNQDISSWDVSSGENFLEMFDDAEAFNQNLCAWGAHMAGNNPDVSSMFYGTDCPSDDTPKLTGDCDFPYSPMCAFCVP